MKKKMLALVLAVTMIASSLVACGGKETEEANCPICNTLLYTAMIDGWFEKSVVSPPTKFPYKKV